jgi:hypothetical protein
MGFPCYLPVPLARCTHGCGGGCRARACRMPSVGSALGKFSSKCSFSPIQIFRPRSRPLSDIPCSFGIFIIQSSVSQSFFASATRLPSPPPSRDRHSDTCGGAVAWRRFPAARGEGWKPTRHTSRPDATAHTYTAHAAHTYVILNAGHNTASAPGFIPRRAK